MRQQRFDFTNEHGERLTLFCTLDTGYGMLWHSDAPGRGYIVDGGVAQGINLSAAEREWVSECWAAANWETGAR